MIYDSLEVIPYKLFIKIIETNNFYLLDSSKKNIDEFTGEEISRLSTIWNRMYEEHLSKDKTKDSKKIFKISKTIDQLLTNNKVILMACASLKFEYNKELVTIIRSYNYNLSTENTAAYFSDLEKIEREANAYLVKVDYYKSMLPKEKEFDNSEYKYTIDDIMASFCAILGIGIGEFNTVSYSAFKGFERQVNAKINSLKTN